MVGELSAAQFVITAGENIDRLSSEASFAGRSHRMRPHCGGDGQADLGLHMIVVARLRCDPRTATHMRRRRSEGLSKKGGLRGLEQFIACEVFCDLTSDLVPREDAYITYCSPARIDDYGSRHRV
jgi:transposase